MSIHTEAVFPAAGHTPPELEQRVILYGVSWETYERLLADFQDSHAAHFTYDRGALEIMVLSFKHETFNVFIFKREGDQYTEIDHSVALPPLTSAVATRFLEESSELRSTAWLRHVREWARQQEGV